MCGRVPCPERAILLPLRALRRRRRRRRRFAPGAERGSRVFASDPPLGVVGCAPPSTRRASVVSSSVHGLADIVERGAVLQSAARSQSAVSNRSTAPNGCATGLPRGRRDSRTRLMTRVKDPGL